MQQKPLFNEILLKQATLLSLFIPPVPFLFFYNRVIKLYQNKSHLLFQSCFVCSCSIDYRALAFRLALDEENLWRNRGKFYDSKFRWLFFGFFCELKVWKDSLYDGHGPSCTRLLFFNFFAIDGISFLFSVGCGIL